MKRLLRSFIRLKRDTGGVAAIEFALITPMLLIILAGIADYGMFINQNMQLQELSNRAAEYVAQGGSESDVNANIIQQSDLYTVANSNQTSITFTGATSCECNGGVAVSCSGTCSGSDYVRSFYTATVTATYTPMLPWPGLASGVTMSGNSRLQYAQ